MESGRVEFSLIWLTLIIHPLLWSGFTRKMES